MFRYLKEPSGHGRSSATWGRFQGNVRALSAETLHLYDLTPGRELEN